MCRSNNISQWFRSLFEVWRREFRLVFSDAGVMIFFFALPTLYPIVYTLIYNPEVVRNVSVAVIDHSGTSQSRELTRMIDATPAMQVDYYAPDLAAARRLMNEHKIYGIVEIPSNYAKCIGNGEQAQVQFYCDMSLLLRYRGFLGALTDVQMALGNKLRVEKIDSSGLLGETVMGSSQGVSSESIMLGDPSQGFASFVMPGILVLILQQSLILGVTMLAAGAAERRRRNGGIDPLTVVAPPSASILGRVFCYAVLYIPLVLYALHIIPSMFSLPHVGNIWEEFIFIQPMILASALMGICLSVFVTERESSMMVIVFTSVVFLFLSGLTWPRYAMNGFWTLLGDFVPGVWGVEGIIRMNSNGSPLWEQRHPYTMMWALAALYFVVGYILTRIRERKERAMKAR